MSAIQDLSVFIDAFPSRIRKAKDDSGMTVEELAEQSGASFSAVSRLYSGNQANPQLYNSAAMCKVLGLSLDELFGLQQPSESPSGLQEQNHRLEVESARLAAANEVLRSQIKAAHKICYILLGLLPFLIVALIAYLVVDSRIKSYGLIQNGTLSFYAWIIIALIAISIISALFAILYISRHERKEEPSCSNV